MKTMIERQGEKERKIHTDQETKRERNRNREKGTDTARER